jgi:hypothetical protein
MDVSATFTLRAGDLFDAHESEQVVMESLFKRAKKSTSPFTSMHLKFTCEEGLTLTTKLVCVHDVWMKWTE